MAIADLNAPLPWQALAGQANAFAGLGGTPQQAAAALGPSYANSYNAALNLNQSLYSGIQTGYQNLRNQVDQQYQDVYKGYQNLYGDVLGRIAGTNQSNITDINSQYNALSGSTLAGLVSRGLGNSTTLASLQRGVELDRARAITASQNQFAQLGAGYASQLGQAGLQSQQQGAQLGTQIGQNQLNFMNTVQAPYPNMQTYSQLAQMYGAQGQANADRAQQQALLQRAQGLTGAGRFSYGAGGGGVSGGVIGPPALGPTPGFGADLLGGTSGYGAFGVGASAFGAPSSSALQTAANLGFSPGGVTANPYSFMGNESADEGTGEGYGAGLYSGGYGGQGVGGMADLSVGGGYYG